MIFLDTSMLVDALCGEMRSEPVLRAVLERGERTFIPSLVLYEWLRGPRLPRELQTQERLFSSSLAVPFGPDEAAEAARLYRTVRRPHGRELDLSIAACALVWEAELWTLNKSDFEDIPGLGVSRPR